MIQTIEFIVIVSLLIYVIYLHNELFNKQSVEDKLVSKILQFDKSISKDKLLKVIEELDLLSFKDKLNRYKFFSEDIINFIFDDEDESLLYLHYTKSENVARQIFEEGFRFSQSFYKTTELARNDEIELVYKHNQRKAYGKYIIVISIAKDIYYSYKKEADKYPDVHVEEILSSTGPFLDENNEVTHVLSKFYVKGFVNYESGEIVRNPVFNAKYDSETFKKNLSGIELPK